MNIKTTEQKSISLTLDLNWKEAMVLRGVVGSITGDFKGPRAITDQIYETLGELGVPVARSEGSLELPGTWDEVEEDDE